jgi:hypothetical protein
VTTENLLDVRFCAVDDWVRQPGLPRRPGPTPAGSDSEVLTFAPAREVLGDPSERHCRRVLRRDWRHRFPRIPARSELNRRTRWRRGAREVLRQRWPADLPAALGRWFAVDATPLPVKRPSRVRGVDGWIGPDGWHAGSGSCAAEAEWFSGFRLAVCGPMIEPVTWVWALVPAAGNERDAAEALLEGAHDLHRLADKDCRGRAFVAGLADQQITLLTPPTKPERPTRSRRVAQFIADQRNGVESGINTRKHRFHLAQHRARTVHGLLVRTFCTRYRPTRASA